MAASAPALIEACKTLYNDIDAVAEEILGLKEQVRAGEQEDNRERKEDNDTDKTMFDGCPPCSRSSWTGNDKRREKV